MTSIPCGWSGLRDLVVWSCERHEWINLLFELMNPDEGPRSFRCFRMPGQECLIRMGLAGPSPCYVMATCQEADSGSS